MPPPPADDLSDSEASTLDSESSVGYEDAPNADVGEETPTVCLFCATTYPTAHEVFVHCAEAHGFDWKKTVKALGVCLHMCARIWLS